MEKWGSRSEAELPDFLGCSCLLGSEGALSSQSGHGVSLLAGLPLASRSVAYGCQGGGATREGKVVVPRSEARASLSGRALT